MKAHLIVIFLIFCSCYLTVVQAQIIYTDINPDSTLIASLQDPWAMYDLDLNNDGTQDFTITHFHPSANLFIVEMNCSQYGQSEMLTDGNGIPKALNKNEIIDGQQVAWYNSGTNAVHMSDNWKGAIDTYLGLRFKKNNNWYYGWARLDVPTDETSFTIKDYAYQSSPGSGIKAGELGGGTGIESQSLSETKIFIQNNVLFVEPSDQQNRNELVLCNLLGINIATYTFDVPLYLLNLDAFNNGIYFIEFRNPREFFVKKIIVCR